MHGRRIPLQIAIVLAASGLPAGCMDIAAGEANYLDTVEKRFVIDGEPALTLSTFDGAINVNTWDRPEVVVRIEKRGIDKAATDRMEVTAVQRGNDIEVKVDDRDRSDFVSFFGRRQARLLVTVPAHARVDATTGDGHIGMQAVTGELRVHSGDGSIRLENVGGQVDATSGDGSIDVDGPIQTLRVRSGDGRVRVHASSSIPAAAEWRIGTGDGSIDVQLPDDAGAELDATTGDGTVRVSGLPYEGTTRRDNRRTAKGRIGNGGGHLLLRSGDGSITVRSTRR